MFETGLETEAATQNIHNGREAICPQDARRSSAPVQPRNASCRGQDTDNERDLALKRVTINHDDVVTHCFLGIAAAVKAELAAIRNMQIDGDGFGRIEVTEPSLLIGRRNIRREFGSCRI